jgi:hypothetical protein
MKRGDFHGEETLELESEHLTIEVLADAGPRIVRTRLAGSSENILGEVPDIGWDTPWGRYRLRGGHRLWFTPENPPLTSAPDEGALTVTELPRGIRLERLEPQSSLRKSMEIELATDRAALTIKHAIRNEGEAACLHSPWALTVLPLGGVAVLPQQRGPIGENELLPNRTLTLWPYSSVSDARLELGDELVLVHGRPAPVEFKIGYLNRAGWAGYLRGDLFFVKHFDPQAELEHPDLGSNVEVFCDARVLELETVAPLVRLQPGTATEHTERWELHRVGKVEHETVELSALRSELGLT